MLTARLSPQHDALMSDVTVSEHLVLFAGLARVPPPAVAAAVAHVISLLGLAAKAHTRAGALSGDPTQRGSPMMSIDATVTRLSAADV